MFKFRGGSNLPPGCRESDIPGNRPEDIAYDKWYNNLSETQLEEYKVEFIEKRLPAKEVLDFLIEQYQNRDENSPIWDIGTFLVWLSRDGVHGHGWEHPWQMQWASFIGDKFDSI